jgi:hypothetical protein
LNQVCQQNLEVLELQGSQALLELQILLSLQPVPVLQEALGGQQ